MRKIFTLIFMACLCLSMQGRTFVLLTAISNYGENSGNNIDAPTTGAKNLKKLFSLQTKDITLLTSKNVTRTNVLEKLRAICNRAQKGDRVVFSYIGHGGPGGLGLYDGFLTYDDLLSVIKTTEASERILFIDACHSGSIAESVERLDLNKGNGNDVIIYTACRPEETTGEWISWIENPFFTQALIKGLRGKSDTNGDRKITVAELYKYIHKDAMSRSNKTIHPQLIAPKNTLDKVIANWKK